MTSHETGDMSDKQRSIRRAVHAEQGRLLLDMLNLKDDNNKDISADAWKRKGNKRNISNRSLHLDVPRELKKADTLIKEVDVTDYKDPGKPPSMWTQGEDLMLKHAVKVFGEKNWKRISELVPGRNYIQCLQRWKKALKPGLKKGHWSKEEDNKLVELVKMYQPNLDWGSISSHIDGRNSKQCRERWFHYLDPNINRGKFSKEEDALLLKLVAEWDGRWALIARYMKGRTENAVKTRFHSLRKKQLRSRDWSKEEDTKILDYVKNNGEEFDALKTLLIDRTKGQIKKRYNFLCGIDDSSNFSATKKLSRYGTSEGSSNTNSTVESFDQGTDLKNSPAFKGPPSFHYGLKNHVHQGLNPNVIFSQPHPDEEKLSKIVPKASFRRQGTSNLSNELGDIAQLLSDCSPVYAAPEIVSPPPPSLHTRNKREISNLSLNNLDWLEDFGIEEQLGKFEDRVSLAGPRFHIDAPKDKGKSIQVSESPFHKLEYQYQPMERTGVRINNKEFHDEEGIHDIEELKKPSPFTGSVIHLNNDENSKMDSFLDFLDTTFKDEAESGNLFFGRRR